MSTPIKNVILTGANGSVGAPILQGLLDANIFNVTVLSRKSSSHKFPDNVTVKRVSDDFTLAELTAAFTGQDAVVIATTTGPVVLGGRDGLAFRFIDAAVAAGVNRFIPSEYAANNLDPRARALVPVYDLKGAMLEYLIEKSKESNGKLTWTSICCGFWLDWALNPAKSGNFMGLDVKAKKALVWDSGRNLVPYTTSTNTGLAVARALQHADKTANKQVFLADFMASTRDIVEALEKETGEKFEVEQKDSEPAIKDLKERYAKGEFAATFPLIQISGGADVTIGYDFVGEQVVWNEKLGLPKVTLEEVVKEAVELSKGS
jgi:nucleoside-diphosphate-sugar epimerase